MRTGRTDFVVFSIFIFACLISSCNQEISNHNSDPTTVDFSEPENEIIITETLQSTESPTPDIETAPTPTEEVEIPEFSFEGLPENWYITINESELFDEIYILELPCWNKDQSCEEQMQLITGDDPHTTHSSSPRISPDGRKIVFYSNRYGNSEDLFVYDLMDHTTSRITNTPHKSELYPAWSPGGQRITYTSRSKGELMIIGYSGCCSRSLPNTDAYNYFPKWSPDGSMIAYRSSLDLDKDHLYIYDLEESQAIELTQDIEVGSFSWSPDSSMIAFTGVGDNIQDRDVCIFYLDQMDFECIVETTLREDITVWSLDGKTLFFRQRKSENQVFDLLRVNISTGEVEIIMATDLSYGTCFSITSRHLLCDKYSYYDRYKDQQINQVAIVDIESHTEIILVEKDYSISTSDFWIP